MPISRDIREERFERHIVDKLCKLHGYVKRNDSHHYDRDKGLDEDLVWQFLESTQAEELTRITERHGDGTRDRVISQLVRDLNKRGVVDIMRNGVEVDGSEGVEKLFFIFFKPDSELNPETLELYKKNIFSVIRQVHFNPRTEQSVDLILFLNGIPLATAELKNELTGQTIHHARNQYRNDRDPNLSLFSFKLCAAHFALDTSEVGLTTCLRGDKTYFLPFNQGYQNGAGNPLMDEEGKHKTWYLWEEVWAPDSWLDLMHHFVHVFKEYYEDSEGKEHAVWKQAFPRYHQRKTVDELVNASRADRPGKNYLIHHSAGSGKSMTIAWTAYRLAELFDEQNEPVFDSVIVLTDRKVLNKQLGETVKAFEQHRGMLAQIGEGRTSQDLAKALKSGAKIITTTIHKFGVIKDAIGKLPAKTFALIVDEAHSSQSGEMRRSVQEVVGIYEGIENWVQRQASARHQPSNVSYYAFTATPRPETLEKFGEKQANGSYKPFSLYSMKQAIEEGFILDVLKNYTTYKAYFNLIKSAKEDPQVKKKESMRRLMRYVRTHDLMVEQKIDVIMTHFENTVKDVLGGEEKAMIVTDSRASAVKYFLALRHYITSNNLPYKALVAFTDTVKLDDGSEHTETSLNGISSTQIEKTFKKIDYKFLVVAEKFQTGFDEPLLCAMYIDKTLSGVNAVQTLSRLNRSKSGKDRVFALDFVNVSHDIQRAFDPYFTGTILSEGVDVGMLGDTRRELFEIFKIGNDELDKFVAILSQKEYEERRHELINSFLDKLANEISESLDDDAYENYKTKLHFYLWLYPYIAQVISYVDVNHEKLYLLLHPLAKKLAKKRKEKPFPVEKYVDLKTLRVVRKHSGSISLDPAVEELVNELEIPEANFEEDEIVSLSEILDGINKRWSADFGQKQQETLDEMSTELANDDQFKNVVKNPYNQVSGAKIVFEHKFDDKVNETYDRDDKLFMKLINNPDLRRHVENEMFKYIYGRVLAAGAEEVAFAPQ
jgi:type I restriction enzyme, R subunit